jgi:predicted nucleic acid-binding protein
MKLVFVDTSAWLALVNKSDKFYEKAKSSLDNLMKQNAKFITTEYVIIEIGNCLSRLKKFFLDWIKTKIFQLSPQF